MSRPVEKTNINDIFFKASHKEVINLIPNTVSIERKTQENGNNILPSDIN